MYFTCYIVQYKCIHISSWNIVSGCERKSKKEAFIHNKNASCRINAIQIVEYSSGVVGQLCIERLLLPGKTYMCVPCLLAR